LVKNGGRLKTKFGTVFHFMDFGGFKSFEFVLL